MSSPDDLDAVVPGSTLTYRDLAAVNDELILRQRKAEATAYVKRRGRPQGPKTRARIAARLKAHRRKLALEAEHLHPLRRARLDADLTQAGLAERALVCLAAIQRIEDGRSPSSRLTNERLAAALKVPIDSLT